MAPWYVSRGQNRIVIVIPSLGIAIKCVRLQKRYLVSFRRDVSIYAKEMLPTSDPKTKAVYWESVRHSFWRNLCHTFRGIGDNWRERSFYKHADASYGPLLQPTFFSFFGLVNVQKYGKPADEKDSDPIYHAFFPVAGQDLIRDGHHWNNAGNFHLAGDGPKLLDYGNPMTQWIVRKYGLALYTRFDIEAGRAQTEKYRRVREAKMQNLKAPS